MKKMMMMMILTQCLLSHVTDLRVAVATGSCAFESSPPACPSSNAPLGEWEVDTATGAWKLVGCPDGTSLVNSTDGTSHGVFRAEMQECRSVLDQKILGGGLVNMCCLLFGWRAVCCWRVWRWLTRSLSPTGFARPQSTSFRPTLTPANAAPVGCNGELSPSSTCVCEHDEQRAVRRER
eukprot:1243768-Rhodomonas_salina.1